MLFFGVLQSFRVEMGVKKDISNLFEIAKNGYVVQDINFLYMRCFIYYS